MVKIINSLFSMMILFSIHVLPASAVVAANEDLSFDVDGIYYEDQYRIFNVDFSTGTEDSQYGQLDLQGTWVTKDPDSGPNPGLVFNPSNGDKPFFDLDTTNGVYKVKIPKPLAALPAITESNNINWTDVPYYINEGSEIDFRSSNGAIASSENVESIKLAFDADRENLKILIEVTDGTDLTDVGFRFVIMPDHLRGSWDDTAYMGDMYPPGSIVVDALSTGTSDYVVKLKVDSETQDATWIQDPSDWCSRDGNFLTVNIGIMKNEPDFFDFSTQDFILECISFNFEDHTPENIHWSKRADYLSPRFLNSRAGGGLEAVNWDYNVQSVSTNWLFAARLKNFNAFSADRINEFKIGMYGNAVAGYSDAPQVSIIGKWVKGFYNGKKYKNSFLFECRVFNVGNSVEGVWLTEDAVEVTEVDPETAVIDISMQTSVNGKKIDFYYRVSTAGDEPAGINLIDTTWKKFNSFEITSEKPLYGYMINKGGVFIRSDALAFPVRLPNWGNSGKNCTLDDTETISKSTDDLSELHGLKNFEPIAPTQAVTVSVDANEKVILSYMIKGTRKEITKLGLMKLKTGNSLPFGNYLTTPISSELESGDWWLTEHGSSVESALPKSEHLDKDKKYLVYFVVQDNDGKYDMDDRPGIILDPTVVGDSSSAELTPTNLTDNSASGGGGGGGCFIQSLVDQCSKDWKGSILQKLRHLFNQLTD